MNLREAEMLLDVQLPALKENEKDGEAAGVGGDEYRCRRCWRKARWCWR